MHRIYYILLRDNYILMREDDFRTGMFLEPGVVLLLLVSVAFPLLVDCVEGAAPPSKAPMAIISHPMDMEFFLTGTEVEFNGSSSYDPDGKIIQWDWWFADGTTMINVSPVMLHTYTTVGHFGPHLMVTDDSGQSSNVSITVVISNNTDPQAEIWSPHPGDTCSLNGTILFSPNGSIDPAGGKLTYFWDFGDNTTSNERFPSHRYQKVGRYRIELQVQNETGSKGMAAQFVIIRDDIPVVVISSPVDGGIITSERWSVRERCARSGTE